MQNNVENKKGLESKSNKKDSKVLNRYCNLINADNLSIEPPFPKVVMVETSNLCNHSCIFCAYKKMTRPKGIISPELFKNIMLQAYNLGACETGLFSGSEPLTCKNLEEYIRFCKKIGYEYVYITTNGALGDKKRLKNIIDSGLDSIKISINGGNREAYKAIHGKDDFEKVYNNVKFLCYYRKSIKRSFYICVSFVETCKNEESVKSIYELFEPLVDEILISRPINQSGQSPNYETRFMNEFCIVPFKMANISYEGYLRGCCNDYQNFLALIDLNKVSLKDAWLSKSFMNLRQMHIENKIDKNVLCYNCRNNTRYPVKPVNRKLSDYEMITI